MISVAVIGSGAAQLINGSSGLSGIGRHRTARAASNEHATQSMSQTWNM
jgi:hypothetical protein